MAEPYLSLEVTDLIDILGQLHQSSVSTITADADALMQTAATLLVVRTLREIRDQLAERS